VKAPEIAIDTLASLRRRGVEATLDIAGRPVDEAFGETLRRRAADLGVDRFVNWLGFVSREDLPAVYASADVFLFPSHWEGEAQGLTYLEAMAVGVPVIAFPLGGARQLLDADPGAAVRPLVCTGDAFADAVQELQACPREQLRMVEAAGVLVRTSASLDRYVDVLESELVQANQLAHPKLQEEAS
jgi:glycosyltransferase involved in cell wall biosynthesis